MSHPPDRSKDGSPPLGGEARSARGAHMNRPRWLRRAPLEAAATVVIVCGVAMLLQPWSMTLFTWSFATTLAGTALFMVVSKFPD